jgi:hypothetical protein
VWFIDYKHLTKLFTIFDVDFNRNVLPYLLETDVAASKFYQRAQGEKK